MTEAQTDNNKQQPKRRFSQEQYDMLIRCSKEKDITEWNDWRKNNRRKDVFLEGADLSRRYLKGANLGINQILDDATNTPCFGQVYLKRANFEESCLRGADLQFAHLKDAQFMWSHLECAKLMNANLAHAKLSFAHLEGADLSFGYLKGADFRTTIVDGSTFLWECTVDRYTDFRGVGLDVVHIDVGTKQLLEYNIRRMNWQEWYKEGGRCNLFLKKTVVQTFWRMSDYGRSTGWIVGVLFGLAILFAIIYWAVPGLVYDLHVTGTWWGDLVRAVYFSVVTMTTLGFGDMYAAEDSIGGHILLMVQVLLGYILLGALVTRFAVLFTAGGPAGTFTNNKKQEKTKSKQ